MSIIDLCMLYVWSGIHIYLRCTYSVHTPEDTRGSRWGIFIYHSWPVIPQQFSCLQFLQDWDYRSMWPCSAFYMNVGAWTQALSGPHAGATSVLTYSAIFLAPQLIFIWISMSSKSNDLLCASIFENHSTKRTRWKVQLERFLSTKGNTPEINLMKPVKLVWLFHLPVEPFLCLLNTFSRVTFQHSGSYSKKSHFLQSRFLGELLAFWLSWV